jgi:hypothetical protein
MDAPLGERGTEVEPHRSRPLLGPASATVRQVVQRQPERLLADLAAVLEGNGYRPERPLPGCDGRWVISDARAASRLGLADVGALDIAVDDAHPGTVVTVRANLARARARHGALIAPVATTGAATVFTAAAVEPVALVLGTATVALAGLGVVVTRRGVRRSAGEVERALDAMLDRLGPT